MRRIEAAAATWFHPRQKAKEWVIALIAGMVIQDSPASSQVAQANMVAKRLALVSAAEGWVFINQPRA